MNQKIEVTVSVIIHATEDMARILSALEGALGLGEGDFAVAKSAGHYENPITVLSARVAKGRARTVLSRLLGQLTAAQIDGLVSSMDDRIEGSKFHVRLGKQELVGGRVVLSDSDPVRVGIHVPLYGGADAAEAFAGILRGRLG